MGRLTDRELLQAGSIEGSLAVVDDGVFMRASAQVEGGALVGLVGRASGAQRLAQSGVGDGTTVATASRIDALLAQWDGYQRGEAVLGQVETDQVGASAYATWVPSPDWAVSVNVGGSQLRNEVSRDLVLGGVAQVGSRTKATLWTAGVAVEWDLVPGWSVRGGLSHDRLDSKGFTEGGEHAFRLRASSSSYHTTYASAAVRWDSHDGGVEAGYRYGLRNRGADFRAVCSRWRAPSRAVITVGWGVGWDTVSRPISTCSWRARWPTRCMGRTCRPACVTATTFDFFWGAVPNAQVGPASTADQVLEIFCQEPAYTPFC